MHFAATGHRSLLSSLRAGSQMPLSERLIMQLWPVSSLSVNSYDLFQSLLHWLLTSDCKNFFRAVCWTYRSSDSNIEYSTFLGNNTKALYLGCFWKQHSWFLHTDVLSSGLCWKYISTDCVIYLNQLTAYTCTIYLIAWQSWSCCSGR